MIDKKAKSILFKTYWSSKGWNKDYHTDPKDFEYAKSKGLMFDRFSSSREELIEKLTALIETVSISDIASAFLVSLGNRQMYLRSPLASYANAMLVLTEDRKVQRPVAHYQNVDLNVLNFERLKWGGVRHAQLLYNWLDLSLFQKEKIPEPSKEEVIIFHNILDCIHSSNPKDPPSKLRDRLKDAMPGSKNDRHVTMEILGCSEILRPGSFDRPVSGRHDWNFVLYWKGEDRFNPEAVDFYFSDFL